MGKRRGGHGEHHGGAWKVAYGDFITSMMALFMVLWILAQNVEVKESIANYFLDPFSSEVLRSPGVVSNDSNYANQPNLQQDPPKVAIDQRTLWELAQQFYKMMNVDIDDVDKPVDIQLSSDGMFITIYNRDDQPIFVPGSTEYTEWGHYIMENVPWLLARVDMPVKIASHVPSGYPYETETQSTWALTSAMSDTVRKSLVYYALPDEDILRITGYGDSQPIESLEPNDWRNQRIELELTIPGSDKVKRKPTAAQ